MEFKYTIKNNTLLIEQILTAKEIPNEIDTNVDGRKILRDKGISEENINNIYLYDKIEYKNSRFGNNLKKSRDYEIGMFLYLHDKIDKNTIYTGIAKDDKNKKPINKDDKGDFFVNKKWFDLKIDTKMNKTGNFYFPIGKMRYNKYWTSDWFDYGEYDYILYMDCVSGTVYILNFNKCIDYVPLYGEYRKQEIEQGRTHEISEAYLLSIQKAYDLGLICREFTFPKEYLKLGIQIYHSKVREIKEGKI